MSLGSDPALREKVANLIVSNTYKIRDQKDVNSIAKMSRVLNTIMQSGTYGITTREISQRCDMTMYAVRRWLIRLEEKKIIRRVSETTKTILWLRNC